MDINLTIIFSAVLTVAVINISAFIILKRKIQFLHKDSSIKANDIYSKLTNDISEILREIKESFNSMNKMNAQHLEKLESSLLAEVKLQEEKNDVLFTTMQQTYERNAEQSLTSLLSHIEKIEFLVSQSTKSLNQGHVQLNASLSENFDELRKISKQTNFASLQQQLSNFEQLTNQVQKLRIENAIELTNALCKHQELQVTTDAFIKHLGECKVLKIEDKLTGQFTLVSYENDKKISTSTYSENLLKYQMFFDESEQAERGVELNSHGEIIFEYHYDKAGEINKRVEFIYNNENEVPQKIEKIY